MAANIKIIFWDAAHHCLAIIALMMEAVSTSETSVNFYQTAQCSIPEDSYLGATGSG
jgi:hypothetical protein